MGAGASIPNTEDEALDAGYTREEIDAYLKANPEARRTSTEIKKTKDKLKRHESIYGTKENDDAAKEQYIQQVNANYLIYDECNGDWNKIAEKIPYTNPEKMKEYVQKQLDLYEGTSAGRKSLESEGREKLLRSFFSKGQVEGYYYD
jgi:hypothetical protein